ncbi:hypothetical protein EC973_007045 [Apophysomyces ossiformis]|uniref:Uncharacterized protein n=1 Tax=Apophysomyces ossiformis TaxID=679940 RepID=A0A8H7EQ26_9FUNG|nr:hypothetical protein EC973_007045 [Apophysomyces ossiformis]
MSDPVEGITTYCIEYARQFSKCEECGKPIPHKSLRAGSIFRKMPQLLTQIPIEQFRGYPSLSEKDQSKVQMVVKQGLNASWLTVRPPVTVEDDQEQEEQSETKQEQKIEDIDMTSGLTGLPSNNNKAKKTTEKKTKKKLKATKDKKKVTKKVPATTTMKALPSLRDQQELESITKEIQASLQK